MGGEYIIGAFGVSGKSENEKRMLADFCAERCLCVANIYKYTRVLRGRGGMKIMRMIDLFLVKRNILKYMRDVKTDNSFTLKLGL